MIPCDLIGFRSTAEGHQEHQEKLSANLIAQAQALAFGDEAAEDPHRRYPGNRPSSTLLAEALTPRTLGSLIALYEHKVFVQGVVWNIFSYDQWGVQLGKTLAARVLPQLQGVGASASGADSSTKELIRRLRV